MKMIQFLIAKRTNVFEYNNKIELVPSGGIQFSSQKGKFIDYKDQLISGIIRRNVFRV